MYGINLNSYVLLERQYGLLNAFRFGCFDEGKCTHIGQTHGDHLKEHCVQWHAIDFRRGICLEGIELFLRVEPKANLSWGSGSWD